MIDPDTSSSSRLRFRLATVLLCVLANGCMQTAKSLVEISSLQGEIIKAFGEPGVHVNLHNDVSLTVTFINSPLNEKSPEERQKRAAATAAFVKGHYASVGKLKEIWVGFIKQKSSYVVITYTEGLEYFGFDKNAYPLPGTGADFSMAGNGDEFQPKAVYSSSRKQTDVSIPRLQLEGDLNEGLVLTPHFAVPGDATGVKRSSLPSSVNLDFAAYSRKPLFAGETKVSALTDGTVVFATLGRFSSSKLAEGKFSGFLFLQVAYTDFHRMTAGENLVLRVGDKEYQITEEQLTAMREMTQYVRE
ncbi:MAG: hypothetical protein H7Z16_13260 [Pyrinomonadaceae bacterium]|nr:hypothetical protein [Pyrinomonadaceae bacterium]